MKLKIILVSILVLIVAGFFLLPSIAEKYVLNQLNTIQTKNPELSYHSAQFSLLDRRLVIDNVHFIKKDSSIVANLNHVKLENISLLGLVLNKKLKIGELTLDQVNLYYNKQKIKEDSSAQKAQSKNKIERVEIKAILFTNGNAQVQTDSAVGQHLINGINFTLNNLEFVPGSKNNFDNLAQEISSLQIDSISTPIIKYHTTRTGLISWKDAIFKINDAKVNPIEEFRYGNKKPSHSINWNDLEINELAGKFNLESKNIFEGKVKLPWLIINGINYSCYKDKRLTEKKITKPMPIEILKSIGIPFTIDNLTVNSSKFNYEERIENSKESGTVFFSDFNATIKNISNDSVEIENNNLMTAEVVMKLVGKENLNVSIFYDLASQEGAHTIKGSLTNFSLPALNTAFVPLANVKFEAGQLKSLNFEFNADNYKSHGIAQFYYDDLKIIFLNQQKIKKPRFLSRLETTLANAIVIRKSNPLRGNFQEGKIEWERDPELSFLNYWWKSTFSGMKASMIRFDK